MPEPKRSTRLKKELSLLDVYVIATGTTLSAGFFLLPGLAASALGASVILAYMVAVIPLVPATLSIVELATAMPRAGGVYYFLDRALGPLIGLIGGFGTWLALILKVAFALIGMGAYIALFIPALPITPVAVALALALGVLNAFGTKKSGRLQFLLVAGLLFLLLGFIGDGLTRVDRTYFQGFFEVEFSALLATAGMVYISYVGVTNVASLSEEVRNPERNLPLGVFLALGTAIGVYALGLSVMVGVVPMERFAGDLTPVATAAEVLVGRWGVVLLSIAAILAFVSVANAGIMSASRYPLAMSRDHLIPSFIHRLGRGGTPLYSILITVGSIVALLLLLDPAGIAKLASAFQLLMFALVCLAVIVMRESRLASYDPGYHAPFYPWMQVFGVLAPIVIIAEMGGLSILFSAGLIAAGVGWYGYYSKGRVVRNGAIYHIFERLGRQRYHGLDRELRGILKEKGLREEDPFEEIVMHSRIIDLPDTAEFEQVLDPVSHWLAQRIPHTQEEIKSQFLEGTRIGATPVTHGVALPHFRSAGLDQAVLILVRATKGVHITYHNFMTEDTEEGTVYAVFFLVSPEEDPSRHLRILAQIAGRVDDDAFITEWKAAPDEFALKNVLLRHDRYTTLMVRHGTRAETMIGRPLRTLSIPDGCLIAWLCRGDEMIVPRGHTVIQPGDRLTIIGDPSGLQAFNDRYGESGAGKKVG